MRFSSGVKSIDNILGGGIETGVITHVYGAFGTGKSIFAQQVCVTAIKEFGGFAIYIDTEGSFNPKLISKISIRFGLSQDILRNILYKRVWSFEEQEFFLKISEDYIRKGNIKLLVLDCLATHLRSEFNQDVLIIRQVRLEKFLDKLIDICSIYDISAIITNQLTIGPNVSGDKYIEKPVGGNLIAKYCKYNLKLFRLKNKRYASLNGLNDTDSNFAPFTIKEDGIHDEKS